VVRGIKERCSSSLSAHVKNVHRFTSALGTSLEDLVFKTHLEAEFTLVVLFLTLEAFQKKGKRQYALPCTPPFPFGV
jgi:hypothetical protein